MNEHLKNKKEFLLKKNKGKGFNELYINDLKLLLFEEPSINEFISLEETDSFKNIHFEKGFYKNYETQDINDLNGLIQYFSNHVVQKYSFLFTYYTQYCGTIKIKTKDFLVNYINIEAIKGSIASILSEDLKNEFLIDFDDKKVCIEVKGDQWEKIVSSYYDSPV